jgi:WD40 repeat protein
MAEPIKGQDGGIFNLSLSPDGIRISSGRSDGTIQLWTLDGKEAASFEGDDAAVLWTVLSPDGKLAVSGRTGGTVRLWTLDGKQITEPFKWYEGAVRTVTFSPDGTRVAIGGEDDTIGLRKLDGVGGDDGTVRLWTVDGDQADKPFKGHRGAVARARILRSRKSGKGRCDALAALRARQDLA